jgi:thiamine-monophosphate kinase
MYKLNSIIENKLIEDITKNYNRSPVQINKLQESDSELININILENDQLAVTTDSIVEEIEEGIYKDPYLIGWMAVMVNMSDLAAVGATPVGILISEILPEKLDYSFRSNLHKGINGACRECGTYVIGGDTNSGKQLIISATAIGIIKNKKFNTRIGCKPGDVIYTTGKLGIGNAYALTQLTKTESRIKYKPVARLKAGKAIRGIASCCIDTSDGAIAALDQIMRLNGVGIKLDPDLSLKLDNNSKSIIYEFGLPLWFLLAGQHGEFELIFSVPPEKESILEKISFQQSLHFLRLGEIQSKKGFFLNINNKLVQLPTDKIRNIASHKNFNLNFYLKSLLEIDNSLKKIK